MPPKGVRKCKICGIEYPYCKTNRPIGISRWQDVCCSPEHAAMYFANIEKSRSQSADAEVEGKSSDPVDEADDEELDDVFDDFDEEIDDELEEPDIES